MNIQKAGTKTTVNTQNLLGTPFSTETAYGDSKVDKITDRNTPNQKQTRKTITITLIKTPKAPNHPIKTCNPANTQESFKHGRAYPYKQTIQKAISAPNTYQTPQSKPLKTTKPI